MTDDRSNKLKMTPETERTVLAATKLSKQTSAKAEVADVTEESSLAKLVADLEHSPQMPDTLAGFVKATESTSITCAAAETNSLAQISDSHAEAIASIQGFRLERENAMALSQNFAMPHSALLEAAEAPARQLRESFAAFEAQQSSFLDTIRHQLLESQASFRLVISAPLVEAQRQISESVRQIATPSFRLPRLEESRALSTKMFEAYSLPKLHFEDAFRTLKASMSEMTAPWLNVQHEMQSIKALIALQDLGHLVNGAPSFSDRTTDLVRVALGDWQNKIALPDNIAELEARTALYRDQGADASLAQFSSAAFDQAITVARIKRPPPQLIVTFQSPISAATADEDQGHELRNLAHDHLQRFETQIRRFIDAEMTAAFGSNWQRQRVPGEIYKSWIEKRQKSKDIGQGDYPLIAFADFTDYEPIISRNDNWTGLFAAIFKSRESLRESLQRLYPIRLATMHAREVGHEDLLFLYVEVLRICRAMGIVIDF